MGQPCRNQSGGTARLKAQPLMHEGVMKGDTEKREVVVCGG